MSGDVLSTAVGTTAVAELLPSVDKALKSTGLSEDNRNALSIMIAAGLGAASASAVGGGAVAQINAASNSANEDKYNRQLHQKEAEALTRLQENATPDEAIKLKAAACAITRCSASVPVGSDGYDDLYKLQTAGESYQKERDELMATGAFEVYTKTDAINDALLRHDELLSRTGHGSFAVLGAVGGVSSFALSAAETPLCLTGIGCVLPVASGALGVISFKGSMDDTAAMLAPYTGNQAASVIASLNASTYPGESNAMKGYAEKSVPYVALGFAGGVLVKVDGAIASAENLGSGLLNSTKGLWSDLQNLIAGRTTPGLISEAAAESAGAKQAAPGLVQGETGVVGTGKPASNDASFVVPKGYTQELDGSVTGPGGGVYKPTGALDSSGNQIYMGGMVTTTP